MGLPTQDVLTRAVCSSIESPSKPASKLLLYKSSFFGSRHHSPHIFLIFSHIFRRFSRFFRHFPTCSFYFPTFSHVFQGVRCAFAPKKPEKDRSPRRFEIHSVDPALGSEEGGARVTVRGVGFGNRQLTPQATVAGDGNDGWIMQGGATTTLCPPI